MGQIGADGVERLLEQIGIVADDERSATIASVLGPIKTVLECENDSGFDVPTDALAATPQCTCAEPNCEAQVPLLNPIFSEAGPYAEIEPSGALE